LDSIGGRHFLQIPGPTNVPERVLRAISQATIDQSGDNLLEMLIRTCIGRLTAQEALGHEEFVSTELYESA
jgi:altronate dehydratase